MRPKNLYIRFLEMINEQLDQIDFDKIYEDIEYKDLWCPVSLKSIMIKSLYIQEHRENNLNCSKIQAMLSALDDNIDELCKIQLLYFISSLQKMHHQKSRSPNSLLYN